MYYFGALPAELIFAQAILKEIGLSFLIHARADSSTARALESKQEASRKMKHIHTRFLFIQDLVFRKLLTMSSVKTDVNPSDIGTKALGRERFHRQMVQWRRMTVDISGYAYVDWSSRTINTCEHA